MNKAIGMRRGVRENKTVVMAWTRLCSTASMRQTDGRVGRNSSTPQKASPMQQSPNVRGLEFGCKSFHTASCTLAGIELRHRLRKGQMNDGAGKGLTAAAPFASLATLNNAIRSVARSL